MTVTLYVIKCFIMIHSLVYRLGYYKAIVSIVSIAIVLATIQ